MDMEHIWIVFDISDGNIMEPIVMDAWILILAIDPNMWVIYGGYK